MNAIQLMNAEILGTVIELETDLNNRFFIGNNETMEAVPLVDQF